MGFDSTMHKGMKDHVWDWRNNLTWTNFQIHRRLLIDLILNCCWCHMNLAGESIFIGRCQSLTLVTEGKLEKSWLEERNLKEGIGGSMTIDTWLRWFAGKIKIWLGIDSTDNNGCIHTCSWGSMRFVGLDNEVTKDKVFSVMVLCPWGK